MDEREKLRDELNYAAVLCIEALSQQPEAVDDEALAAAGGLLATADRSLHRLVRDARDAGMSWSRIGDVLGVSRQAAQQRFAAAPARHRDSAARPIPEHVLEVADTVLDAVVAGDMRTVEAVLGASVRAVLGPDGMGPQLAPVVTTFGSFISRTPLEARAVGRVVIVTATEHRSLQNTTVRVTLTDSGRVLGLHYGILEESSKERT